MFGLGMGELVLIFFIALIFLGPKKLPELAQGLGKAIRDFNKAKSGVVDEFNKELSQVTKNEAEQNTTKQVLPKTAESQNNTPSVVS